MRVLLLVGFLAGCNGPAEEDAGTQDVRVDHTSPEDPVESTTPRSCAGEGGQVYTVWQDDRSGTPTVWFNASDDGGLTWMTADTKINVGEAPASAPDVACAGSDVWIVWEDERDGDLANHNIYLNRSSDGGRTWLEEDVLLDGDVEGDAMSLAPRVAAAGGAVYVTWFDNRDGAYDIFVQASENGGERWLSEPSRVDSDGEGESYSAWPRVAAGGDGSVVVVWEDSRSGASDIYANVSTDHGATFGTDQRLDGGDAAGASNSFLPDLAVADGRAYVVWHDERHGAFDVLMNVSGDMGRSWASDAARVSSHAEGLAAAMNPVVAATGQRVHVAWQDDRSGGYDVYLRTSTDGGAGFGAEEVRLDTDTAGAAQSYDPAIAVAGETVMVVWQDRRSDTGAVGFNDLFYNYSGNGGQNWSEEDLRVNSNEPGSAYAVDPAVFLSGQDFVVVWADGRFGSSDIFAAARAVGEESVYVPPQEDEEGEK